MCLELLACFHGAFIISMIKTMKELLPRGVNKMIANIGVV
jgi:hypothetical protein